MITGANAGLGFQTALQLARMGAHVVMACRSTDRGGKAEAQLHAEVPDARTTLIQLDVSEPESIQEFGRRFAEQVGALDVLVNNAGIVGIPLARNSVGHELQLATNYLVKHRRRAWSRARPAPSRRATTRAGDRGTSASRTTGR